MRIRQLASLAALTVACAGAACTFEQSTELFTPAAPSLPAAGPAPSPPPPPPPPDGTAAQGSLLGTWTAHLAAGAGGAQGCSEMQWLVTEQTDTTVRGTFTGLCRETVFISGNASAQLNGSDVQIRVDGTASAPGQVAACPFTLDGLGRLVNSNEMRVEYEGSTCFGPVSGEETLLRDGA